MHCAFASPSMRYRWMTLLALGFVLVKKSTFTETQTLKYEQSGFMLIMQDRHFNFVVCTE
jgi:hypothetical protein